MRLLLLTFVTFFSGILMAQVPDTDITDKFHHNEFKYTLWRKKIISDTSRIMLSEVDKVKELNLSFAGYVTSLSGLEQFRQLEKLFINWYRGDSILLDLSGNPELRFLKCSSRLLCDLNARNCKNLEILDCRGTNLDTIDLSLNTNLKELKCGDGYYGCLKCILLPQNPDHSSLEVLQCSEAPSMDKLDLSSSPRLRVLKVSNHQIKTLDLSKCPELDTLIFQFGKPDSLDLSHCPHLSYLDCSYNQIKFLDLSQNYKLNSVIVSKQESKYMINENGRTGKLETLILPDNTHSNTGIATLKCDDNQLKTLDLSRSVYLQHLDCSSNHLKYIDLSNNLQLTELDCSYCYIRSLDLQSNLKLEKIYCGGQGHSWIMRTGEDYKFLKELLLPDQNKNLPGTRLKELSYPETDLKFPPRLSHYPEIHYLNCSGNNLKSLNTGKLPELKKLWCHNNPLTSLRLKKNKQLQVLNIRNIPMRTIDLKKNLQLKKLEYSDSPNSKKLLLLISKDKDIKTINFSQGYTHDSSDTESDGESINPPPSHISIKQD